MSHRHARRLLAGSLVVVSLAGGALAQPVRTPASDAMAQLIEDASLAGWFHLDPLDAIDFVFELEPLVLDVRQQHEYDAGHLEGAVRIYVTELDARLGELPRDLDAPMLVYCTGGLHGTLAMTYLRFVGYRNVRNLRGGFLAWQAEGLPYRTE